METLVNRYGVPPGGVQDLLVDYLSETNDAGCAGARRRRTVAGPVSSGDMLPTGTVLPAPSARSRTRVCQHSNGSRVEFVAAVFPGCPTAS